MDLKTLFVCQLIFALVGAAIGAIRIKDVSTGLLYGLFFGPLGWMLIAFDSGPKKAAGPWPIGATRRPEIGGDPGRTPLTPHA